MGNAITCPFYRCSVHGPERLDSLPETHSQWVSETGCEPLGLTPGWRGGPGQCPTGWHAVGLGGGFGEGREQAGRPGPGPGDALPPARRGPRLAPSPRGQALQGKQKSVVSTVPNPKWLRPSCNPIKVRLVYLSSSGLFITVQMAATLGGSAAPCQPPAAQS